MFHVEHRNYACTNLFTGNLSKFIGSIHHSPWPSDQQVGGSVLFPDHQFQHLPSKYQSKIEINTGREADNLEKTDKIWHKTSTDSKSKSERRNYTFWVQNLQLESGTVIYKCLFPNQFRFRELTRICCWQFIKHLPLDGSSHHQRWPTFDEVQIPVLFRYCQHPKV